MKTQKVIAGLGELLWDLLPDGARLGGAPANFSVMAGRLGNRAILASRIGRDRLGEEALEILGGLPVDTSYLQRDEEFSTGTVTVELKDGEPAYTIHEPVAWDRLALTDAWQDLAKMADAVCFGTLAQRDLPSRRTITAFLDATRPECVRVFDLNLRAPFWSAEVLRDSMGRATVLKLNAGELPAVLRETRVCRFPAEMLNDDEILDGARHIMERFPVKLVCVTLGDRGSLVATHNHSHRHPGVVTEMRDAVGAGDAFTAALVHYYLEGAPLAVLNEAGNRWGSWVASQSGAMPALSDETRAALLAQVEAARVHS